MHLQEPERKDPLAVRWSCSLQNIAPSTQLAVPPAMRTVRALIILGTATLAWASIDEPSSLGAPSKVKQWDFKNPVHVLPSVHGSENFNWLPPADALHPAAKAELERARPQLAKLEDERQAHEQVGYAHWPKSHGLAAARAHAALYARKTEAQSKLASDVAARMARTHFAGTKLPPHAGPWVPPQLDGAARLNGLPRDMPLAARLVVHDAKARMSSLQMERREHVSSLKMTMHRAQRPWLEQQLQKKTEEQQRIATEAAQRARAIHNAERGGPGKPDATQAGSSRQHAMQSGSGEQHTMQSGSSKQHAMHDAHGQQEATHRDHGKPRAEDKPRAKHALPACFGRLCGGGKKLGATDGGDESPPNVKPGSKEGSSSTKPGSGEGPSNAKSGRGEGTSRDQMKPLQHADSEEDQKPVMGYPADFSHYYGGAQRAPNHGSPPPPNLGGR